MLGHHIRSAHRADKELRRLQSQLDRQMQKMQRSVSEAEADYQVAPWCSMLVSPYASKGNALCSSFSAMSCIMLLYRLR